MRIIDSTSEVMRWILNIYQRHGEGLDIEIKTHHKIVEVRFSKFKRGELLGESRFKIEIGAYGFQDFVEKKTEAALKDMGAEFISLHDLA